MKNPKNFFRCASALCLVFLASSCGKPPAAKKAAEPTSTRVVLQTTAGDLVVSFFPQVAPRTVKQFIRLAKEGVLDTTHFFSISPGFLAQTSWAYDRSTPMTTKQKEVIRRIPLEVAVPVPHTRGMLSMGRDEKDPNSAETSFCIMLGSAPHMDGKYTVFGKVESGLEVLAEIEKQGTSVPTKPRSRIELRKAVVVEKEKDLAALVAARPKPVPALLPATAAAAPAAGGESAPSCHPAEQGGMGTGAGSAPLAAAGAPRKEPEVPVLEDRSPPKGSNPVTVQDRVDRNGENVRTVLFKDLFIDKLYPSMRGPWTQTSFKLLPESPRVWVTGYRAEVMDGKTGRGSQEFMCHTNLDLMGSPQAPPEAKGTRAQLSISQGQTELHFPRGYGLRLENQHRQINLTAMVLNSNYPDLKKSLDFKSTIRYLDDEQARKQNLKPLFQTSVYTVCPIEAPKDPSDTTPACQPATSWEFHNGPYARKQTGHWIVPPGRQEITHDVTAQLALPYDTTIHYIWIHLHPYGEMMELKDKTTGKTVWKGRAKNHATKAMLLATDSYSSTSGLKMYKDHQYELTTVYNNRSNRNVTAMAALWMYARSRD